MWPGWKRTLPDSRSAMLSVDEHPGILAFLSGLIVVVFAGVVLSMAVDRRFDFSSSSVGIEKEIRIDEAELEGLRRIHGLRSWSLSTLEPERNLKAANLADLRRLGDGMEWRLKDLIAGRDDVKKSIPVIEDEFFRYRMIYRKAVREAAINESLGTLVLPGGHEYHEAFITRVTEVGLEIRHAHGTARISATDLNSELHSRFQWDDEERTARLGEKPAVSKTLERIPATAKGPEKPPADRDEVLADPKKIQMLRGKVIAWRSKVSQLRSERSGALSSSYGSQASPPGRLETWQARAARLGGEIARAEAELAAAKAALAVVAPDDALLRPHMDNR